MPERPATTATIFPAFRYADAPRAVTWLADAFGFEAKAVHAMDDGKIAHAELKYGNGIVMFGSARDEPDNPWAEVDFGIYVVVDDVDAHHARAKAAGAEIVYRPGTPTTAPANTPPRTAKAALEFWYISALGGGGALEHRARSAGGLPSQPAA